MSNVLRLPTAARRKVEQPCNKAGREARAALRERHADRFRFAWPSIRDAEARIRALVDAPDTIATVIARRLVASVGTEQGAATMRLITLGVKHGDPVAIEVQELLTGVTGRTVGEVADFQTALVRLGLAASR